MPYKKWNIYLTKKYVVSGMQAIKYEDIIWIYIVAVTKYGVNIGKNLIIKTKNKKEYTIASVKPNDEIISNILDSIKSRNTNIKVGYNDENVHFFENYRE